MAMLLLTPKETAAIAREMIVKRADGQIVGVVSSRLGSLTAIVAVLQNEGYISGPVSPCAAFALARRRT
jgi:hypothetical protein